MYTEVKSHTDILFHKKNTSLFDSIDFLFFSCLYLNFVFMPEFSALMYTHAPTSYSLYSCNAPIKSMETFKQIKQPDLAFNNKDFFEEYPSQQPASARYLFSASNKKFKMKSEVQVLVWLSFSFDHTQAVQASSAVNQENI